MTIRIKKNKYLKNLGDKSNEIVVVYFNDMELYKRKITNKENRYRKQKKKKSYMEKERV